jgi:hypothetical protein
MIPRPIAVVVLALASVVAASCDSMPIVGRGRSDGPSRLPAEDVQAEVMAFADSYTALVSQAADRVADALPAQRSVVHTGKVRSIQAAINIAAGANPVGALLDMTVMVTLQRQVAEDHWTRPDVFGEAGQPLLDAYRTLETEIWTIARRHLDDEVIAALEALIPAMRERYERVIHVGTLRASDFAEDRLGAGVRVAGGGSLLQLFHLDPLAGLSPASQELAQTRFLAERTFFWAKRLPLILNWQLQDVVLDMMDEPESLAIIEAATRLGETGDRLARVAEDMSARLPEARTDTVNEVGDRLAQEREAAVEQLAALVAAEREVALEQAFEGLAAERQAIVSTFEQEDARLRGLMEDLRVTIETGTTLSESLGATVASTRQLRESFRSDGDPDPDRRPFDIADYRATAEAFTVTAGELNRLVTSLEELLASPDWESRRSQLGDATDRAQVTFEQLIDRAFRRGLVLIGVLLGGGFVVALLYRFLTARLARAA